MKKIIGMLALCVCVSISNAALMFILKDYPYSPENRYYVIPGDTVTINVVADTDVLSFSIGAITVVNASSWGNNNTADFGVFESDGSLRDGTANNIGVTGVSGTNNVGIYFPAGTVLFSFDVTVPSVYSGTATVIDDYIGESPFGGAPMSTKVNTVATTLDPIIINAIPEPMTMALLGLGGLFIRRRNA